MLDCYQRPHPHVTRVHKPEPCFFGVPGVVGMVHFPIFESFD
jgi:hypothetical protein